jgi:tryptophan-rich sensory protein
MKNVQHRSVFLFIFSFFSIGLLAYISGQFTKSSVGGWYVTLTKSPLNPPDYVFPLAWSILYLMIAFAFWRMLVFKQKNTIPLASFTYFTIQLCLNFLWSPVFFYGQSIIGGLLVIVFLWFFLLMTMLATYKYLKIAAWLLVPYFLWVTFALYLNGYIYVYN